MRVANSAGQSAPFLKLEHFNVSNPNSSVVYIQFFDAASGGAVTPGTTAPLFFLAVPASGVLDGEFPIPVAFSLGIVICATGSPTGGDMPATAIPLSLHYE